MATQPPESGRLSAMAPHQARAWAESFGSDPARYDRARPRYPDALVRALVAAAPGRDVLDVGCGTGISARAFQAAGCRVLGVDVDERMAGFARARGLPVEIGTFEAWDPGGRTFDLVVAGQTWHWIDPVAGAAKAAEVLRPGGGLAVFWNAPAPSTTVRDAFSEVYARIFPDWNPWARPAADAYGAIIGRAADGIAETGAFGPAERSRFDWERSYTRDEWLEQIPTGGDASQFAPETLAALLAALGAAIDELGGAFTMGYASLAVSAPRR